MLGKLFGKKNSEQSATKNNKAGETSKQQRTEGILVGPIQSFEEDKLNMAGPALALAKLLAEVEPPFTVGLRGDWGSGKSSMLQMIKSLFDESQGKLTTSQDEESPKWRRARTFREKYAKDIKVIEFNPWANSELFKSSDLSQLLLERFIKELQNADMISEGSSKKILPIIARQALEVASATVITRLTSDDGRTAEKLRGRDAERDKIIYSDELRSKLEEALRDSKNETKILFLIDDLDRLPPNEAIKILDVITSLLKMPRCLFLIAVDQDIIAGAVAEKLTYKAAQNYFDKVFNVSIRLSNTLSNRQLSELVSKPLGTGEQNQTIPKLVQAVIELCAFRNPRTLKRLMWLSHYRQIENAEARLFIETKDKNNPAASSTNAEPKVTAIDELCAALGAVEDAYGTFHSLVFPAIPHNSDLEPNPESNDHAKFINAALRIAAKKMKQNNVDETNDEIDYFLEQYQLTEKRDELNKKAEDIRSSLAAPEPTPPGIDAHEQKEVFAQNRDALISYFRDITDKLLPPPKSDISVSNQQGNKPHTSDDIYASRRSSGWLATYMATHLWQDRRAIGGYYSLPQQIYRYMSREWDFAAIYVDTYGGFLRSHIDSFVIYVGAQAMEIYFKPADGEQTIDFMQKISENKDLDEQLKGEDGKNGRTEEVAGLISLNGKRAPTDEVSVLLFRFEFTKPLKDNKAFEERYDRLTEMARTVLSICISEIYEG